MDFVGYRQKLKLLLYCNKYQCHKSLLILILRIMILYNCDCSYDFIVIITQTYWI